MHLERQKKLKVDETLLWVQMFLLVRALKTIYIIYRTLEPWNLGNYILNGFN